jgi:hypothetical protein
MNELEAMVRGGEIRLKDYVGADSAARVTMALQVKRNSGQMLAYQAVSMDKVFDTVKALKGPNPTPLEEIAAEAVVMAWLDYQGKAFRRAGADGEVPVVAQHYEKALSMSLRRLSMAVRMLDQLRRTDLTGLFNLTNNVQVNVEAGGKGRTVAPAVDVTPEA